MPPDLQHVGGEDRRVYQFLTQVLSQDDDRTPWIWHGMRTNSMLTGCMLLYEMMP